mmetsp:Transcript_11729/g.15310  ORF Transcript_11729/g.15310 Transcript_11729/m.15310 type:complete len:356 (-) Transcript_11729:149-1216(-)|eukprot:CAMPEP_0116051142 /NCGR_PEP_ID=MMETSP0322-20121206/803_1 /TAXON_ID=163516 /ORGANISM="Leptocylindrus danicus var. apora, Strain B651" /LENGTH=355 /DNA_ID=CAMNT_0003533833 /DNA_START=22 /DNA_END=1089 /DNA_ORIENTATION=+
MRVSIAAILFLLSAHEANSFGISKNMNYRALHQTHNNNSNNDNNHPTNSYQPLHMLSTDDSSSAAAAIEAKEELFTEESIQRSTNRLSVPASVTEMCREAASAMRDAYAKNGNTRQIIRVLLPRDSANAQLGMLYEADASRSNDVSLVPPDETWQGGIMQLYRAAAPTCKEILREFSPSENGIPPKLVEDRSVDESGVDGVGLWITENVNAKDDVSCFVQPTQESLEFVETISSQAGNRLVLLMNPQWRNVDDALDATSKNTGFFGMLASSLGGKGNSLRRLDELGFETVYTIEGYVCKNRQIRLVKRFDSDWRVFVAADDDVNRFSPVGTSKLRPSYQDCDKMLDEAGIVLNYL